MRTDLQLDVGRHDAAQARLEHPPSPWMRRLLGADVDRLGLQKGPAGGRLDWIVGGDPQQVPERHALLSPTTHVQLGCPPTLLMQGRDDIIVPPAPAIELRDKLRSAGVQAALLILPYADHGFDLMGTDWSPSARQALWHAERFLALVASHVECGPGRKRLDESAVPTAAIAREETIL